MDSLGKTYKVFYRTRRWTASILAAGLALKNGLPHILPVNVFMTYNASLDCANFPTDHLIWLIQAARSDAKTTGGEIVPFVSTDADVSSAGSFAFSKFKQPCVIGIPKNFFCTNVLELDRMNIQIGSTKKMEHHAPNEKQVLQSLLLSDSAQKFAVTSHLVFLKENWAVLKSLLPSLLVMVGYMLCFHAPKLLFARGKPINLVLVCQITIVCMLVSVVLCKIAKSVFAHWMINSIDRTTASISKEYAQGGLEYFQKMKERNMAQRALLGKKGERLFTVFGNHKDGVLFNWHGPPITEREKKIRKISNKFA